MGTSSREVRDIVRAVIASQESHELPYFETLARADDEWALARLRRRRERDEPLAFGIDQMVTLATPLVWVTLNEAAKEFGTVAGGGLFSGARLLLRRIFRCKPRSAIVPPLTEDQRRQVHDTVYQSVLDRGLGKKRAGDIANAVYFELPVDSAPATRDGEPTGDAPAQR